MNKPLKTFSILVTTVFALLVANVVLADDTEIYLQKISLPPDQIRPNVVFILDSSGSMGLPVDSANGTAKEEEKNNYNSSTTYIGDANYSGGAGDSNYYYLYLQPNTYADQYIYLNKVHKNQMTCDMSTLADSTPYTGADRYVYEKTGSTTWALSGTKFTKMCAWHDASCDFTPGPTGPQVDCESEENHISSGYANSGRPNDTFAVSANFHNYLQAYYRYTVLQTVMRDLIDADNDINMSMMRFNGGSGGYIFHESILAEDPADPTNANQQSLRDAIDDIFKFNDLTPLTETLWEGYRYLAGLTADYGDNSGTNTPSAAYSSGTTYDSPIDYACQKSHLILLTDGAPFSDTGRDSSIESSSYIGPATCSDNCLDEFADWIHNVNSTIPVSIRDHSNTLVGDQEIAVHTIGFGAATNATLLQNAASNGGGLYKTAATASELTVAFTDILNQVNFEKDTFVAPAVAINAYSGLQHRDELYFALFQPSASPRWNGNIKKYRLLDGIIVDALNVDAIDDASSSSELNTGYFKPVVISGTGSITKPGALSIWTTKTDWDDSGVVRADGDDIEYGGFAYELTDPSIRKIYTYISSAAPSSVSMSNEPVLDSNNNITTALLGLGASNATTEAERTDIITWTRGEDNTSTNTPHYFLADVIHNQPSIVTYYTDSTDPLNLVFDDTLYSASNMGLFHAIDTGDGTEEFAFIPQELLPNLTTYYQNLGGFSGKVYGLDAAMTIWRNDGDADGSIVTFANGNTADTYTDSKGAAQNDHVYIYQAMRRGGKNIYAFDVTSRANPKLLWQINGGTGPSATTGFSKLTQTWSVPQRGKVKWGSTDTDVLLFGGGYDTIHDTTTVATSGDQGSALYMVDARTGALIWSVDSSSGGNFSGMDNSMVANVAIADVNGDGYTDFLFAVDIQGTMWRIDFPDKATSQTDFVNTIEGGSIAELGATSSTASEFRRFFNAPDVAYFTTRGKNSFLTIAVTSGYRASPRETLIDDYLFVIFDPNALTDPTNPNQYNYVGGTGTIGLTDLFLSSPSNTGATTYGWYMALGASGEGEKGLSRTITFDDEIIMTTYVAPSSGSVCDAGTGSGRYYLLDAQNGKSTLVVNGVAQPYIPLDNGGIPPDPAVIFTVIDYCISGTNCQGDAGYDPSINTKKTSAVVCVGTECKTGDIDLTLPKTYWREN